MYHQTHFGFDSMLGRVVEPYLTSFGQEIRDTTEGIASWWIRMSLRCGPVEKAFAIVYGYLLIGIGLAGSLCRTEFIMKTQGSGGLGSSTMCSSIPGDPVRDVLIRILRLLQSIDLLGEIARANAVVTDSLLDLIEAALESTGSANTNKVPGCAAFVLVVDGRILAKDVTVAHTVNVGTGIAVLVLVLLEP